MSQPKFIPFNKPYVAPNAMKYIEDALSSDHHQGGGPFNKKAAELVQKINGGGEVFLTSSCTQALEMATILLDLKPGDEVILPSFTFTSAATALVDFGVIPIFVDIEASNLNIDPNRVRDAVTPKTKAISVVNYAGYACDFAALDEISKEFGLLKIEDNAHGFGVNSNGHKLGTWGDVSVLSFHATKNIQCGEGGALIVNNKSYLNRAYILQEKGTNRKKYLEGSVEKYQWVDKGGSYLMPEICSALLLAQVEEFESIQAFRNIVFQKYYEGIIGIAEKFGFNTISFEASKASHMFWMVLNNRLADKFMQFMKLSGIQTAFHYQPLHDSAAGRIYGKHSGSLQNTHEVARNLVRLPLWRDLKIDDAKQVVDNVEKFFSNSL